MVPSVSVQQGLTVNIMRPMTPYLNWEKIGGREGHYKKGKGSPAILPQP